MEVIIQELPEQNSLKNTITNERNPLYFNRFYAMFSHSTIEKDNFYETCGLYNHICKSSNPQVISNSNLRGSKVLGHVNHDS